MPDSDRWTVRGVSPLARQRATAAARAARMPVGSWLVAVIANAAALAPGGGDLAERMARLEDDVSVLKRRVRGR